MTIDRFQVPEPSETANLAATTEFYRKTAFCRDWAKIVAAAYAVDVPNICRAEVERALGEWEHGEEDVQPSDLVREYLDARYGLAPDNEGSASPDNDSREALRPRPATPEQPASHPGVVDVARLHGVMQGQPMPAIPEPTPTGLTEAALAFLDALALSEDTSITQNLRAVPIAARAYRAARGTR